MEVNIYRDYKIILPYIQDFRHHTIPENIFGHHNGSLFLEGPLWTGNDRRSSSRNQLDNILGARSSPFR